MIARFHGNVHCLKELHYETSSFDRHRLSSQKLYSGVLQECKLV